MKKAIEGTAFLDLCTQCSSLKKTSSLRYECFGTQDYLLKLFPGQARTVFKWRSKTLDLKSHSTYKYDDELCRGCGTCNESAEHVVNCNQEHVEVVDIAALHIITDDVMDCLRFQTDRIKDFMESVDP